MCDLSEGFRLCTCADDGPFDWTLERFDADLPPQYMLGRWLAPTWDDSDELRKLFLLEHLNGPDPFDVPWEPREGDVFRARLKEKPLVFRFEQGRWVEGPVDPFVSWASQMVEAHRGVVELPPDAVPAELLERAGRKPLKTNRSVLRDWILSEGHPTLAGWLRAREAREPFEREEQIGPRLRARLLELFPKLA